MRLRWLLALAICFISILASAQTSFSAPHIKVSLVAENESLQPGKAAWIGIRFQLEKGWHVYWQNPGDSGEPPKVEWKLPEGVKASGLQFPAPRRLPLQTLMNFGYEDDALYLTNIAVPATAKGDAALSANVRWMICKDTCIPGKATLGFSLPVAAAVPKPSQASSLVKDSRDRLPRSVGLKAAVAFHGGDFVFTGLQPAKSAEFFPLDDLQVENAAAQKFSTKRGGFELVVRKSDQLAKPPARLRGVLVLDQIRAYAVDLHLSAR